MSERDRAPTWQETVGTALLVFVIAAAGCLLAFAFWLQELNAPQVTVLGAGDNLSLLISDGPARLILASGDDAVNYENALSRVRPLFARRVDVLLIAGSGESLLVPLAARDDPQVRSVFALAPLSPSPETDAMGAIGVFTAPQRIRLGPSLSITVETARPFGADRNAFPAWRTTIERGESRVVVLSDGEAAALFPPADPAAVLVVAGDDPVAASELSPAAALVANAQAVTGPELRDELAGSRRPPTWTYRVFPGEALRLHFVPGGISLPAESAQRISGTPESDTSR